MDTELKEEKLKLLRELVSFNKTLQKKISENSTEEVKELLSVNIDCLETLRNAAGQDMDENFKHFLNSYIKFSRLCNDSFLLEQNWQSLADIQKGLLNGITNMFQKANMQNRVCACCGHHTIFNPLPEYYFLQMAKHHTIRYTGETINPEEYFCIRCQALDRDRLMVAFLQKMGLPCMKKGIRFLQIAPSAVIEKWIINNCPNVKYESTDLYMENVTFRSDIQDLSQIEDDTYDFFICSHVLEHVKDDRKAMRELRRILKPDGVGLFLVPIAMELEEIDEEWGLSEEENWRRFGQNDHCRRYARKGMMDRLEESGFFVHPLGKEFFGEKLFSENAFVDTSTLYVLSKTQKDTESLLKIQEKKTEIEESPLVSVFMSCYNHENFVGEAIESVIGQTYKNIEFLVADDGSSDGSVEVMKKYSQYFTEEHYFEENYGGRGRFLRERAKGKYIAIMNSDDVWERDKIEKQVKFLENNQDYIACFSWTSYVNENLETILDDTFIQENRSCYQWMYRFFKEENCLCHPSILMRREEYNNLLKYNICAFRQLPDFAAWVRLIQKEKIYVFPERIVKMRRHSSQSTQNVSAQTIDSIFRHLNESMYLWYTEIRDMEPEYFKNTFRADFVNKDAQSEEEITCEKYFLLKGKNMEIFDMAAMLLLFDIYKSPEIRKCFREKYDFKKKDVYNMYVNVGIPHYNFQLNALKQENEALKKKISEMESM